MRATTLINKTTTRKETREHRILITSDLTAEEITELKGDIQYGRWTVEHQRDDLHLLIISREYIRPSMVGGLDE